MASFNTFTGLGNASSDYEVRQAGGRSVESFRMAVSNSKKVDGTWVSVPLWFSVEFWLNEGQEPVKVFKGDRVLVTGSLYNDQWRTKDGQTRDSMKLRARSVITVPKQPKEGQVQEAKSEAVQTAQTMFAGEPGVSQFDDDPIPF